MAVQLDTESQGKVKLTAEVGLSGLRATAGYIMEEYDPDLRGIRGVRIYEEMRRSDPTVATGLRLIRWIIGQVNWHVEPGGEAQPDKEAAEFIQSCMDDMSLTWHDFIDDALSMLAFGWAWFEVVYKLRNGADGDPPSLYDDGRIGWRKLLLVSQESLLRWELDDTGGIKALIQQDPTAAQRTIPIEKSLLFRLDKERNNPEGVSLLRACYLPWYKKRQIEEIEAIGIERDLTGVLIIYLPIGATSDDHDKARDLLEQFKADDMCGFIAPQFGPGEHERFRFEIINSPGSKSIDIDKAIGRYQAEIIRAFLAQFALLGETAVGSYALAKELRGIFELGIGTILRAFEETLNRFLVPPLFRFNDFGKIAALPQVKAGRVSGADMAIFSESLGKLTAAGVLTPGPDLEKFVRDEMNLPALPEPEKQVKPEETGKKASEPDEAAIFAEPMEWPELTEEELLEFGDVDWDSDLPQATGFLRHFAGPKETPLSLVRARIDHSFKVLDGLAHDYKTGVIPRADFIRLFHRELVFDGRRALQLGQRRLTPKTTYIPKAARQLAGEWRSQQMGFVPGLLGDLDALSERKLAARLKLYAQGSEGLYHKVVSKGQIGKVATWHLGGGEHCAECPMREGKSWPADAIPHVPRDGSTPCLGNCRCYLTYEGPKEFAPDEAPVNPKTMPYKEADEAMDSKYYGQTSQLADKWFGTLPSEQGHAVFEWSDGAYRDIRSYQITGRATEEVRSLATHFNTAMKTAPDFKGTIYRGLHDLSPEDIKELANAKSMVLNAHSSFAVRPDTGYEFALKGAKPGAIRGVVIEARQTSGKLINTVESEVLVGKGQRFRIVGREVQELRWKGDIRGRVLHLIVEAE